MQLPIYSNEKENLGIGMTNVFQIRKESENDHFRFSIFQCIVFFLILFIFDETSYFIRFFILAIVDIAKCVTEAESARKKQTQDKGETHEMNETKQKISATRKKYHINRNTAGKGTSSTNCVCVYCYYCYSYMLQFNDKQSVQ